MLSRQSVERAGTKLIISPSLNEWAARESESRGAKFKIQVQNPPQIEISSHQICGDCYRLYRLAIPRARSTSRDTTREAKRIKITKRLVLASKSRGLRKEHFIENRAEAIARKVSQLFIITTIKPDVPKYD